MQREKYALAIEQYRLVLESEPNDPAALNNIAWAMNKTGTPRQWATRSRRTS